MTTARKRIKSDGYNSGDLMYLMEWAESPLPFATFYEQARSEAGDEWEYGSLSSFQKTLRGVAAWTLRPYRRFVKEAVLVHSLGLPFYPDASALRRILTGNATPKRSEMWEYRTEKLGLYAGLLLEEIGQEGWELCGVRGEQFFFKRRWQPPATTEAQKLWRLIGWEPRKPTP